MWFLIRLVLLAGGVLAVRSVRGDEAAIATAAGGAALFFGGALLRRLAPRGRRAAVDAAAADTSRAAGGAAPSRAEYLNAGVDTRTCGRCRRPIRGAAFFFSLDDRPTVYCEPCWNLVAPADDPDRRGRWMTRLAGGFERRGA